MLKTKAKQITILIMACVLAGLAGAAEQPLSVDDVRLLLIGGSAPVKMAALIEQRGISFRLTPDMEKKLRDDGADNTVIQALQKAEVKPPTEAVKTATSTQTPPPAGAQSVPSAPPPSAPSSSSSVDQQIAENVAALGDHSDGTPHLSRGSASAPPAASPTAASTPLQTASPPPPPAPGGTVLADPSPAQIQSIIQEFAAKEKLFRQARDNYTFHQSNKVETLDPDDNVSGQWQQDWDILYDDSGKRIERVTYAPPDNLKDLLMTEEDMNAFRTVQPFVLTSDELPEYEVKYLGHVKVDEVTAYVFSVRPREIVKGRQYFQGVVWVDDRDLQIVKSEGKNVPELKGKHGENLFPRFTTYREQIDGKYWFPTFTMADDKLYFEGAGAVHIKEIIRYSDYKQFKSKVRILSAAPVDTTHPPANPPGKAQGHNP